MRWTVPNILTIGRLLAAPAFALCYAVAFRPMADILALGLFVGAAVTDYLDGHLARRWNQVTSFGRMLDPIADKAMVIIALAFILGLSGLNPLVIIPAALILFREIFVSGLREFLGANAGQLKVTSLAKWKTTAQMIAIIILLATGILQSWLESYYYAMDPAQFEAILTGQVKDTIGLTQIAWAYDLCHAAGLALLWLAALLTVVTGLDYFSKSLPYLGDERS